MLTSCESESQSQLLIRSTVPLLVSQWRPTQREAPRKSRRAVSILTSTKGANARSAGGRESASKPLPARS